MRSRLSFVLVWTVAVAAGLAASTASAASCVGVPAFQSCTAYSNGTQVIYNNSRYHSIVAIPSDRDCPPAHPYDPGNDNWWVNDGSCDDATATATRTSTATATSGTRTATATATRTPTATATSVTATRTNTATATRTNTATATATGGGSCAGVPTFQSCTAYPAGQKVVLANTLYHSLAPIASNRDCPPNSPYDPTSDNYWVNDGACTGPTATATPTATNFRPTPTNTAIPTTPVGPLPAKVITGYWQNFNNGAPCLRISDVPAKYNLIAVAFADATGTPGAVSFTLDSGLSGCISGGYTTSQFISDIATVKGRGQHVIVSVGGQNGTISVSDSGSAANFANSVVGLMNTFGFEGVDIDLENGISSFMTTALNSIRSQKSGAIITMAPQTIDMQNMSNTYPTVAKNANVDIVNTQFYNSGCMLGCDQNTCYGQGTEDFLTMLACIQVAGGLRGDQIGFGVPAVGAAAPSGGYVSPSVVNAAMSCMKSGTSCNKVPSSRAAVRGAMTWSINWDASSGYAWVNGISVP